MKHWFYSNDSNEAVEVAVQKKSQMDATINIYKNLKHEYSCSLGCYAALTGEKLPGF
jgi:hypothetical protein